MVGSEGAVVLGTQSATKMSLCILLRDVLPKGTLLRRELAGPGHSAVAKREWSLTKLDPGQREEPGLGMLTRPVQVRWALARGREDVKRLEGAVPPSESPHSP